MLFFIVLIYSCICRSYAGTNFNPLRDDILFQINWLSPSITDINKGAPPGIEYNSDDAFVVTSVNQEKYKCTVPSLTSSQIDSGSDRTDEKSLVEVLLPLMKSDFCSYYVEAYWTYELCHGKYLRQYHEERIKKDGSASKSTVTIKQDESGKVVLDKNDEESKNDLIKTTEFFLGYFKGKVEDVLSASKPESKSQVPKKMIKGVKTPYLSINMTDGTTCDLKVILCFFIVYIYIIRACKVVLVVYCALGKRQFCLFGCSASGGTVQSQQP